jgi:hypothetical protein
MLLAPHANLTLCGNHLPKCCVSHVLKVSHAKLNGSIYLGLIRAQLYPSHEMTNQAQPSTIRRPTQQASTSKDPTSWAPMLNPSPTGPVDQVVILSKSSPDEDEQGIIPETSRPSFCDPSRVTLKGNSLPKDDSDEDEAFAESSEIRDFIQPIISET